MAPAVLLPTVVASAVSAAVAFSIAMLVFPPASRAEPTEQATPRVVRAGRFELVDTRGAVRATLGLKEDGATTLTLQGQHPQSGSAELAVEPDGNPSLNLSDRTGQWRVGASLDREGSPSLAVRNAQGMTARLAVFSEGTASLALGDSAEQPRIALGLLPDGTVSLTARDQAGRPRTLMGLDTGGMPTLRLLNETGQPLWQAP